MRLGKAVQDREEVRYNTIELMQALRNKIESGELRRGTYMPTVRRLSKSHRVSANTALRALRILADQSLIEARPRRGFWICESKPVAASFAYLMSTENIYAGFDALYKTLMHEFHSCAGANREHVTAIVLNPGDEAHIIEGQTSSVEFDHGSLPCLFF